MTRHPRQLVRAALALLGPLTLSAPLLAAQAGDDAARWQQVRECANRGDSRARQACVDEVLRAAGALTPEAEAREQRQRFGLEPKAPAPPARTPAPTPPERAPAPAPAPPAQDRELQVQVASVRTTNVERRLVFTTADGAEWRQTESQQILRGPEVGDTIVIHRALLGGYLCELPKNVSWRCARTR